MRRSSAWRRDRHRNTDPRPRNRPLLIKTERRHSLSGKGSACATSALAILSSGSAAQESKGVVELAGASQGGGEAGRLMELLGAASTKFELQVPQPAKCVRELVKDG